MYCQSFISPTNAQPVCFKILKFTLKYTINAFIVYFYVNFNSLRQTGCALVGLKKYWIRSDIFTYKQQYTLPNGRTAAIFRFLSKPVQHTPHTKTALFYSRKLQTCIICYNNN
jgi:hypothetical protein